MGAWSGNWQLSASTEGYKHYRVGKFKLSKVAGKYKVQSVSASNPAKWAGSVLSLQPGKQGPALPWPVPTTATPAHFVAAGNHLRAMVKSRWKTPDAFEYLHGPVPVRGGTEEIALFKANKGLSNGKDFLMAVPLAHLDGAVAPAGSVSGRRV